jgi:hypothetical protein
MGGTKMTLHLRLDQGPFGVEQDVGWCMIASTTPSNKPVRNFGYGMIGYTWEENGPSIAARKGLETLEQHVEKLAALPFTDVLYIRCDWRDVQSEPGKLNLHPVWKLTFDAAKKYGLRVAFRIQMSSPNIQPEQFSMPDFLLVKVPMVNIGRGTEGCEIINDFDFYEPRYDHPEFKIAFRELNELLAAEFDGNPYIEFMDLMMYGFWGEGHTQSCKSPFPDYYTAQKTFMEMTEVQLDIWKRTNLVVNTQPDISNTGNRAVQEAAINSGCWLRTDSILIEEPIQIDMITKRPPWMAAIVEDGYKRHYRIDEEYLEKDEDGINLVDKSILHALDAGANYWSLWTEADNLKSYYEKYPEALDTLWKRMGYKLRPSWVWQRKRHGTDELIVAVVNDGVASVPGILHIYIESMDGKVKLGGCLDTGHPLAGKVTQASFILPTGFNEQIIKIRAELETRGSMFHPIQWVCKQPLTQEGSFIVKLKEHNAPGWRKGI